MLSGVPPPPPPWLWPFPGGPRLLGNGRGGALWPGGCPLRRLPGARPAPGTMSDCRKGVPRAAVPPRPRSRPPGTPERSREEQAALTLQRAFRRALARKEQEQAACRAAMDQLQKEAFLAVVKRERQKARRAQEEEEEKQRKQREEQLRKERILEAAFDGDVSEITAVLREVAELDLRAGVGTAGGLQHHLALVNCTDIHGNTPLSEAASGGHAPAIRLLVEQGADPNCRGAFGRTPLYRAAFAGHLAAMETLLQLGADPRLFAADGSTPVQVASAAGMVDVLQAWDISFTEAMLAKIEAEHQRQAQEDQRHREANIRQLRETVQQLEDEQRRCHQELQQAYRQLNQRMAAHSTAEQKSTAMGKVTLQAVREVEEQLDRLCLEAAETKENLSLAQRQLEEQGQEHRQEEQGQEHGQDAGSSEPPRLYCSVRELNDVLLRDVGGRIQAEGRWPLVIDPSGQAAIFLRYQDTNYLDTLNPAQLGLEPLRLGLLGALRYGKPLVLDMHRVDMFGAVKRQLEAVEPGLADALLTKALLEQDRFLSLVRPEDGPEYEPPKFQAALICGFKLFFLTQVWQPPDEQLRALLPLWVLPPGARGSTPQCQ
ncbi:IQ motif and ankyrin repeat domain-containing protein 1 isoform X3 [Ornithorhynchus anatinus]|uniref:IQ motif and ankyrin repeat domain-containing protein 1 isoform X3 n=1 Tax=Ornithorhynchus anatinus TaxID=9258 RepID=UPI0019D44250|nr:IQ motif and ankyrin repeat domain-containing protein 1 isoform X3 [Ornithorhynchus anatinus]